MAKDFDSHASPDQLVIEGLDFLRSEQLIVVLESLVRAAEVDEPHSAVVRALRLAIREIKGEFEEQAEEWLVRAGSEVGLNIFRIERRLSEVLPTATPKAPWVARTADGGWLAVLEHRAFRTKVRDLSPDGVEEWIGGGELARRLGIEKRGQTIEWIVAEASAPLAPMESHHGGHGHGHAHMTPFERIRSLLRAESTDVWVVLIYSLFIGLLSLVVPIAVQWLVNTVAFGTILQPLVVLTVFVFVALGFSSVLTGLRVWVVELIQQRLMVRVSTDVVYRLQRARLDAFDRTHAPELVNRFFDVVTVQKAGATLLVDGVSIVMQATIGLLLLATYHPLLLVFGFLLLVLVLLILFVAGRGAQRTAIEESICKYSIAAWLETVAANLITFKSGSGSAFAIEQADMLVRNYLSARKRHFRVVMRQIGGFLALQALASSILLGVGGWLVIQRELTLGQLVAAELVVTLVVGGLAKFGKHLESFYDLLAAMDKLGHLVDLPLERHGGESLPPLTRPAGIQMREVSFSFGPKAKVIEKASLSIPEGARVGLVGPIGSGKSSVLDLLYGLRTPTAGTIEIDGWDYREISLHDLRTHVALVRNNEIFEGTVIDNVRLGRHDLGSAGVREALEQVGLLDEIQNLPQGLKTVLSTAGRPLSPGQAGRLMLARAIAGQPRLLILDETIDYFDDVRDREFLFQTLFGEDRRWTIVIASSSPEILERCDHVYMLVDHHLVETDAFRRPRR
jgi:ABC-type bacteriocin/lantibiotic exporter with double-glycine peptidase domain